MSDTPSHLIKRTEYFYRLPGQDWRECSMIQYYGWITWAELDGKSIDLCEKEVNP